MTLFNLSIEGKTYTIDLFPEVRAAITRNTIALYENYRVANPDSNLTLEEYLVIFERQAHPENQVMEIVDEMDEDDAEFIEINEMLMAMREQLRYKDVMIEALCDAIKAMK